MSDFTTHYITAKRAEKAHNFSKKEMQGMLYGVEGPDYLFYASIFKRSDETNFGYAFHNIVPKAFFEKCVEDLRDKTDPNYEIKRGYVLGQLLHYFGDSTIHPYVEYLTKYKNADNFKYIHMQNEADIDLLLYEMEYGKSIGTFNPCLEYKYDENLEQVVFDVWNNQSEQFISKKVIKKGCKRLAYLSKVFNMNKFKWIVKLAESKSSKGVFMCHYKDDINPAVLNSEREEWTFDGKKSNMSVPDIIDVTMEKFALEMAKIENCMKSGEKYVFEHNLDYIGLKK